MMIIVWYILIWLIIMGMCIVRVRSDRSRLSVLIPGLNYYTRTQIAWRSMGVSISTTLINLILLTVIIVTRYRLAGRAHDHTIWYNILTYLEYLPELIYGYLWAIIPYILLQIWVNRWVAHRRGRGLWTWLELTFFAPIFWMVLWFTNKTESE